MLGPPQMTSDVSQLGFLLFLSALVAMLSRRLRMPIPWAWSSPAWDGTSFTSLAAVKEWVFYVHQRSTSYWFHRDRDAALERIKVAVGPLA